MKTLRREPNEEEFQQRHQQQDTENKKTEVSDVGGVEKKRMLECDIHNYPKFKAYIVRVNLCFL